MKVLVNALSAKIGGGVTYIKMFVEHVPPGSTVFLLCDRALDITEKSDVIPLRCHPILRNPIFRAFYEFFIVPILVRKHCIELLFCPGGLINQIFPCPCPMVTMCRNMEPFDAAALSLRKNWFKRLKFGLLKRSQLRSFAVADLVIFISEYARNSISRLVSIKSSAVIYHGISDAFRKGVPTAISSTIPDNCLLYVSRFEPYKMHFNLVKAYALLADNVKERHRLVFVGEYETAAGYRVKQLISELGLEGYVILTGPIENKLLPSVYGRGQLVIFASICENCPNILLEAMSAGKGILCSDVQPMPEIAEDSVSYFDPMDTQATAEALDFLLSSPHVVQELGARAKLRSQQFSWEVTFDMTWREFKKLRSR